MTKKSFADNPAINFMSTPEHETATQQPEPFATKEEQSTPEQEATTPRTQSKRGRKPVGATKRDVRLNLLITPELHEKLKALADFDRRSLNAMINKTLESYAESREADYKTYMAFLRRTEGTRQK